MLALTTYSLQRTIEIYDHSGLVLTRSQAEEAASCMRTHLESYSYLAWVYWTRRELCYKIRCKSHYLFHVADETRDFWLNQNLYHTFAEESWLGKLKAVAQQCHGRSVGGRVYQQYFLALAMILHDYKKLEVFKDS